MPSPAMSIQEAAASFCGDYSLLRNEIGKLIVGHDEIVEGILICLFAGGHALLEGVPGLGKTLLVRTLSNSLDLDFARVQFTPDLMPADITGTTVVVESEGRREFEFKRGPIFSQMVLADEINRATPKTQSALLEAMQEYSVTAGGQTHQLDRPFFVMATQNPIEQEGTYPLPEAQLDRFFFKLHVGYSNRDELMEILNRTTSSQSPQAKAIIDAEKIIAYQKAVRQVSVSEDIQDYVARIVLSTHPEDKLATPQVKSFFRFGASPRAAQTLVLAGKVQALLNSQTTVSVDNIRSSVLPALRHRCILNFEAEAEGVLCDDVLQNLIDTLPTTNS